MRDAVRNCHEAVIDRLNRNGYAYVTFGRPMPDHNPGPYNSITGFASGEPLGETRHLSFSCSVDSWSGRVRFVDVLSRKSSRGPYAEIR